MLHSFVDAEMYLVDATGILVVDIYHVIHCNVEWNFDYCALGRARSMVCWNRPWDTHKPNGSLL